MPCNIPPKTVVVGYEPSGRSDAAVCRAFDMLKRFGARLEVVHAVDLPPPEAAGGPPDRMSARNAELEGRAWDYLVARIGELADTPDVKIEDVLHVTVGHPAKSLIERANALAADMIILGHHERRGLVDFGSTTRAVISKASCNLWAEATQPGPVRRILVPTDVSDESLEAVGMARDFAASLDASVRALHCYTPPQIAYAAGPGYEAVAMPDYVVEEESRHAQERFHSKLEAFDWKGVEHDLVFEEGSPVDAALAHQDEVDLIALGSHGRTGLAAVLLGNVAYGIMREARIPVLALRQERQSWLLS
ncbi:MAG: universal stress protein [bacterium]|nr:universal stress protein [bacterium]